MFENILVLCVGNICRSPIGERLLKKHMPEKTIDSAGIQALVGQTADEQACKISSRHDLDLSGHIAKQVSKKNLHDADLILVMERIHMDYVYHMSPEAQGKTLLYGHWNSHKEISDPYRKSDEAFELIFHSLEKSAKAWVKALNS